MFETSQSLFWASFGLVDLVSFELTGIKGFTRFWALLMFGSYSVINVIVLLNMLIAMMSNSYQIISVSNQYTLQKTFPETIFRNEPIQNGNLPGRSFGSAILMTTMTFHLLSIYFQAQKPSSARKGKNEQNPCDK